VSNKTLQTNENWCDKILLERKALYGRNIMYHVWKWKNETCWTIPGMGGGRIKENDGGVNSTMI
jgi:hypothetical protein